MLQSKCQTLAGDAGPITGRGGLRVGNRVFLRAHMCGAVPCIISPPPCILLLLHVYIIYVAIISRADCLHTSALLHYAGAIRAFAYAASQWKCGLAL